MIYDIRVFCQGVASFLLCTHNFTFVYLMRAIGELIVCEMTGNILKCIPFSWRWKRAETHSRIVGGGRGTKGSTWPSYSDRCTSLRAVPQRRCTSLHHSVFKYIFDRCSRTGGKSNLGRRRLQIITDSSISGRKTLLYILTSAPLGPTGRTTAAAAHMATFYI